MTSNVPSATPSTSSTTTDVPPTHDPDSVWFFLDSEGNQRGPTTPMDLQEMLQERLIDSNTYGWRSGLTDWVPLSTLPELKGIFATAFDAPDEQQGGGGKGKGKQQPGGKHTSGNPPLSTTSGSASATAASASATATATAATPADPAAVWFYTDRSRTQQGPVTPAEIIRLYGLLSISDATLVYSAQHPQDGWTVLSDTSPFKEQVGPVLLDSFAKEREEAQAKEEKRLADRKRKREREKEKKAGGGGGGGGAGTGNDKWKQGVNNTSVYIQGLPLDVTEKELHDFAKKAGIILEDEEGRKRIKIYLDEQGKPKGDAVIKYAMHESVDLAITLLDQSVFRAAKPKPPSSKEPEEKNWIVTVQQAQFTQKQNHDATATSSTNNGTPSDPSSASQPPPAKKPKKQPGGLTGAEIARQKLRESLSWDDDPSSSSGGSSKLKIVIMKPMFSLAQVQSHAKGEADFYAELKREILEEIEESIGGGAAAAAQRGGRGCVEKLTVFQGNLEGPVAVKFRDSAHAQQCINKFNGRFFGGSKLTAFYFDGKTNYMVQKKEESAEEEEKRLKEFGDWIEGNGEDGEGEAMEE